VKVFAVGLLFASALVTLPAARQDTAQRRVVRQNWEKGTGATSIDDRVSYADAIAVVTLSRPPRTRAVDVVPHLRRLSPDMVFRSPVIYPVTVYAVEIDEVLREHPALQNRPGSTFGRVGGQVQVGNVDLQIADEWDPGLMVGERYLVFLQYVEMFDMLMIDEQDVFHVDGSLLVADSKAPRNGFVEELNNENAQLGVAKLKEMAERVPRRSRLP
jgi:hypothetical protein